jgi:hypothetical protein
MRNIMKNIIIAKVIAMFDLYLEHNNIFIYKYKYVQVYPHSRDRTYFIGINKNENLK